MVEVGYITVKNYHAQLLWIKQQLKDYDIEQNNFFLKCDNTSTINLTKNLIQYSRTKHIEIWHHFIRVHVQNNDIVLEFISTKN